MKLMLACLSIGVGLAACTDTAQSVNRKASALNKASQASALKNAQRVTESNKAFSVAVVSEASYSTVKKSDGSYGTKQFGGPYALVKFVEPAGTPYFANEVVKAANAVSGCRGSFGGGIIGTPNNSTDLAFFESKIKSNFNGWRVDLTC